MRTRHVGLIIPLILSGVLVGRASRAAEPSTAPTSQPSDAPSDAAATTRPATRPTKVVKDWGALISAYHAAELMYSGTIQSIDRESMTVEIDPSSGPNIGKEGTKPFKLDAQTKVLVEVPAQMPRNLTVHNARPVRLKYGKPGDVKKGLHVRFAFDDVNNRVVVIHISPPGAIVTVGYPPLEKPAVVPDIPLSPVRDVSPKRRSTTRPS
jgi:hypothetical protein